jgi:hypothetical protein
MRVRILIAVVAAAMMSLPVAGSAGEEATPLTEAVLAERGIAYLDGPALRSLVVGRTLTIRNRGTGEFFEARYGTDGKRHIRSHSEETGSGGTGAPTAPVASYVIHDARITTSYHGKIFEVRVYLVDGKYLAGLTTDQGSLNWEIVDIKE